MDNYDRWRDNSPRGSQRRKLSFQPTGSWVPPTTEQKPAAPFEVSKTKRILQVAVAVVYCLFAAGIIFGYAALKPVLINEGVYRDRCTSEELEKGVRVCYEQEIRLNFMFTVAAVATNVNALPVGTVLDRFGPRISGFVGCFFLALGALSMAFADSLPFDGYIPGYLFLALGGPFVFISSFQLSNTFPRYSGLILALLTGAFDTSSAIFLFYRLIYQASHETFTPRKFFLAYLAVPVCILLAEIFLMPARSYKTVGELVVQAKDADPSANSHDECQTLTNGESVDDAAVVDPEQQHHHDAVDEATHLLGKDASKQSKAEKRKRNISGVWGALHGKSAWQQIRSPWFVLITLFTVIQMTRINYFVATIRPQYEYLLHSYRKAVQVNTFFDVALPAGGVISVPFIGLILDNTSTPFVLAVLVTIAAVIGVLGEIGQMWAAYANVCLFVVYRPLYYTAVSDYAAKVFGFATFGKVYGLIICLAGLLNFIQSGLDALTHGLFRDDPRPINAALLVVEAVVGVALVGFVYWRSRSIERERLEEEAEGATQVLIPGADREQVERSHGHDTYGVS
ncbi:MFS general substrate transporter [Viridothelium virens]|uniref:MFS general substrate transporter n=1 Tax=Viridothelium virens TaxID=1048519 RepID=A0A6A6HIH6_VIRVR|nr:MFS general substrate transporter [Viridothelium virens]